MQQLAQVVVGAGGRAGCVERVRDVASMLRRQEREVLDLMADTAQAVPSETRALSLLPSPAPAAATPATLPLVA